MRLFLLLSFTIMCAGNVYAANKQPADEYQIHADGGLIYNPLSREASRTGQLKKYSNVPVFRSSIKLDGFKLEYSIPKKADAYDVIPIKYRLSWNESAASFPAAVEATAFEDIKRRKNKPLYDLALPGKLDLKVAWLGSITANVKPELRNHMKVDLTDAPGAYPPFVREPFTKSGVVKAGDLVWFKFRIVNTGNTILDSEGFGGITFTPELYKINPNGDQELVGVPYNTHIRELAYLYPGESKEIWIMFRGADGFPQTYGLNTGKYKIRFRAIYRWYKHFDDHINMWMGNQMYVYDQPFAVEESARKAPIEQGEVVLTDGGEPDKLTRWIHTFEEFMTAFDCHISKPSGKNSVTGTLYLQTAPWTKAVVIKLIKSGDVDISADVFPIDINTDLLKVKYDADHQMNIVKDGLKEPVILALSMADMRANVQHSPYPEQTILNDIREMKKCGVNMLTTTCMPWLYESMDIPSVSGYGNEHINIHKHNSDGYKYALDAARYEGIPVEGWGSYPFNRNNTKDIALWLTGKSYDFEILPDWGISYAEPQLPEAVSSLWLYQLHRWGDNYFVNSNNNVPITIEDTQGMLRQDINGRWFIGDKAIKAFREWLKEKYISLNNLNRAWDTNYASFDEINPEEGQTPSPYMPSWPFLIYNAPGSAFYEWGKPLEDFDVFRTEQRVRNYEETINLLRKEIPNAVADVRTEGSNVIVANIDPQTPNPHFRHIYYSQRRSGVIAEIIQKSNLIKYHADYPTLPFTPTELRYIVRQSVEQGITPMYMPQFNNMRDMALNSKYGSEFQIHYNLPAPKKAVMMHVLTALYPWFTAVYEEGGTPGILWQDYECDGYASETQRKEMMLFKEKLNDALNEPKALELRKASPLDDIWKQSDKIKSKMSYDNIIKQHAIYQTIMEGGK